MAILLFREHQGPVVRHQREDVQVLVFKVLVPAVEGLEHWAYLEIHLLIDHRLAVGRPDRRTRPWAFDRGPARHEVDALVLAALDQIGDIPVWKVLGRDLETRAGGERRALAGIQIRGDNLGFHATNPLRASRAPGPFGGDLVVDQLFRIR